MEYKEHWLNDHGMLVYKHKENKSYFATRAYHWVDRITFLDESELNSRRYDGEMPFSDFLRSEFSKYELVTKEEYSKVTRKFREIYGIIDPVERIESRGKKKIKTFVHILEDVAQLSVSQTLKVGCLAIKHDFSKIGAFGYNGTYPNAKVYKETGGEELSMESGKSGFLHAEENMIAKFRENDPENYFVLVSSSPCRMCAMRLVNAGFKEVYYVNEYRDTTHLEEIFKSNDVKYGTINLI